MGVISNIPFNKSVRSMSRSIGGNSKTFSKAAEKASPKKDVSPHQQLISQQELFTLAAGIKSGSINRAEASTQFISAVVDNCINGKLSAKDRERLINDISEFFSDDPEFQKRLEKNLSELA